MNTKRLLIIAVISTLLLWTVTVLSYYLTNYPEDFNVVYIVRENLEWKPFLLIYLALIVVALTAGFLFFKKKAFSDKFYKLIIVFNLVYMMFFAVTGINQFRENKNLYDALLAEFKKDAADDIKNDNVKSFGFGLEMIPHGKQLQIRKSDSILKIYGLSRKNLGCTIYPALTKASEEYERITDAYLNKRNGKDWKIRLKTELQKINKE